MSGDSADDPQLANLVNPPSSITFNTANGDLVVDMERFAEAAEALGAQKQDVLSIGGYRNAKGELVPDYDSVRIERRADE